MDEILLKRIVNPMTKYLSVFSNGLSGIGWGIEYLAQHQFVELSADETLQEIDNKVMERDLFKDERCFVGNRSARDSRLCGYTVVPLSQ